MNDDEKPQSVDDSVAQAAGGAGGEGSPVPPPILPPPLSSEAKTFSSRFRRRGILFPLLAVVILGLGTGGYLLNKSASEHARQERARLAAARVAKEKKAAADRCFAAYNPTIQELRKIDSLTTVGVTEDDYGHAVQAARIEYDSLSTVGLTTECMSNVGNKLSDSLDQYQRAGSIWNDCIVDFSCSTTTDSFQAKLSVYWVEGAANRESAETSLSNLGASNSV